MPKSELRKEWEMRVKAFKASGQSTTEWCAINSIKPHQLRYWLRKQQPSNNTMAKPSQWLTVEIDELESKKPLLIKVGPVTIEVMPDFDPILLSSVVKALAPIC